MKPVIHHKRVKSCCGLMPNGAVTIFYGTSPAIDRSDRNCHRDDAMKRTFAITSYYYPDEVGTG